MKMLRIYRKIPIFSMNRKPLMHYCFLPHRKLGFVHCFPLRQFQIRHCFHQQQMFPVRNYRCLFPIQHRRLLMLKKDRCFPPADCMRLKMLLKLIMPLIMIVFFYSINEQNRKMHKNKDNDSKMSYNGVATPANELKGDVALWIIAYTIPRRFSRV